MKNIMETKSIFKKNIDLNVSDFAFEGMILLHEQYDDEGNKKDYTAEKCFTCGAWTLTFVKLNNIGDNEHPQEIKVGQSCAEYFEMPDNFSALALSEQRAEIAQAERDRQKVAIEKLYKTEPELAQMGEFLSEISDFSYSFKKIKYDLTSEEIQELKDEAVKVWGEIVKGEQKELRLSTRVQLENGLQEITGTVEKIYWKETQWGGQEKVVLEVNDNTLFVNKTKAFTGVEEGDVITIDLEVTMFEENQFGEKKETFTGYAKAGRINLKDYKGNGKWTSDLKNLDDLKLHLEELKKRDEEWEKEEI